MTTLKFQNRLAKLMKAGDVQTVHHELARLPLKEALNFNLLQSWVEILSCTGMASVQSALRGARTGRLSVAERTIVNSFLAVEHWLQQDWQRLESLVAASLGQAKYEVGGKDVVNAQSHMKLCVRLFAYRLQHPADYGRHAAHSLIAIGDSHCLVPAGRTIQWGGRQVGVQSMPIRGIKMFHLGLGVPAKYRAYFRERLRQLPADADVLLSIGEIDCRPNEGIFYTAHKDAGRDLKALLEKTVADFVTYVHDEIRLSGAALRSVTLQGVPWPAYEIANRLPAGTDEATFFAFIDKVNEVMQREAQRAGWQFLDVKTPTGQNAGGGAPELRLDDIHLSPCFYDQADQWRRDVSGLGRDDVKLVSTSSHPSQAAEQSPTFLHVDCGQTRKAGTTPEFSRPTWKELRQDSDPGNQPDIIGSVVDMSRVPQGSVNAIFSKNDINRLYPQQVESVLQEFLRVLTPDGYLVISCPDLKSICALVAQDRLTEPVGRDEHGPLAPLDLIYGNRAKLSTGDQSAAFKCGFTANVLAGTLNAAGFQSIAGKVRDRAPFFDICLVASKQAMEDSEIKKLVGLHFPD